MQANHTTETILKAAGNFQATRVLLSGAELDIFTLLAEKPLNATAVAEKCKADLRGITILLDALTASGYLIKTDGLYQTEPSAVPLLSADSPESLLPIVLHQCSLWKSWSHLTDIITQKLSPDMHEHGALSEGSIESFIGAMHVIASKRAPEVVAAINPGAAKRLLDVGSGSGTYSIAFLHAQPDMQATLFDMPKVIDMAKRRLSEAGLENRAKFVTGDFYKDPLPKGHDLALLSAIIHQNSLAENLALYHKIHEALEPGGRFIVRDYVMSADRTTPPEGTLFAVNMLAGTKGGGTYTYDEIADGLTEAGFHRLRLIQTKGMFSLVEGFKKD